jgi:hypothetical protein
MLATAITHSVQAATIASCACLPLKLQASQVQQCNMKRRFAAAAAAAGSASQVQQMRFI